MTFRSVVAVWAITLLPGIGAGLVIWKPGAASLATRLGVAVGLGYGVLGLISLLLAVFHGLTAPLFLVLVAAATAVMWVVGLRRSSLGEHVHAIGDEVRHDPWSLAAGFAVILAIAIVRFGFTSHVFATPASFRYWADGLEVRDAHGFPRTALMYGTLLPAVTSKAIFNTFNASSSFLLGRDPFRALPSLLALQSIGLGAALWALGRELGLRMTAPLLPILLVMNQLVFNDEMTWDMTGYKAEVAGRLMAASALVLGIRAVRARVFTAEAVVAGLLFAIGAGTHLIPIGVGVTMLALYAIGMAVRTRELKGFAIPTAAIGATALVAGFLVLVLPRGEIGFGGAFRSGATYEDLRRREQFDPTAYLLTGNVGLAKAPPAEWQLSPGRLFRVFTTEAAVRRSKDRDSVPEKLLSMPVSIAIAGGTLALAVAVFLWFPAELRPLGPPAWGLGAVLFAVTLFFSLRYDVFVLGRFGLRRMTDYASVPLVLLGLTVVEAVFLILKRRGRFPVEVIAAVLVLVVAAVVLPSSWARPALGASGRRVEASLQWVRRNVPCSARILAGVRTSGTFEAATGRVAILEGMAPYLRPPILDRVITTLTAAKQFFHDPVRHRRFLRRHGVDVIVVFDRRVPIGFLNSLLRASPDPLERAPFLKMRYRSRDFAVFDVRGARSSRSFPDPTGRPGFTCLTSRSG